MKIRFTKAPTFTKGIVLAAVFAIIYLASTSSLPSCSDPAAMLASGGECIERQSFLHTASGWLALISLAAAVVLLAIKHKDSILGHEAALRQSHQGPQAHQGPPAGQWPQAPAPVPGRAPEFCAKCGTRIISGDRFCQGCGITVESH
jgi:hypothetical protein